MGEPHWPVATNCIYNQTHPKVGCRRRDLGMMGTNTPTATPARQPAQYRLAETVRKWATFAQQTEGQRVHKAPQRRQKGRSILQQLDYSAVIKKRPTTTHNYNPLEPCIARMVPTSGSPVVPTNSKENERFLVIRGETAAVSGAKSAARTQSMGALPGFILLSVLLKEH